MSGKTKTKWPKFHDQDKYRFCFGQPKSAAKKFQYDFEENIKTIDKGQFSTVVVGIALIFT